MKKIFLILMLLGITTTASAQFYAGGSFGVNVEHAKEDGGNGTTMTTLGIAPELGYSINRTWAVGLTLPVNYMTQNSVDLTVVQVLPYVRATFARASIVDFFGELALGYGHQSVSTDGVSGGVSGFVAGLRPGLKINFSDKFALVGRTNLLSYSYYDGLTGVNFSINSGFSLGFQVNF